VAIDGSKFKAVNNRDKDFTDRKLKARMQQLEESIARYMSELDRADREPALVTEARVEHVKENVTTVKRQMRQLRQIGKLLRMGECSPHSSHRNCGTPLPLLIIV
jgi:hypothetical protein